MWFTLRPCPGCGNGKKEPWFLDSVLEEVQVPDDDRPYVRLKLSDSTYIDWPVDDARAFALRMMALTGRILNIPDPNQMPLAMEVQPMEKPRKRRPRRRKVPLPSCHAAGIED